MSCRAAVCGAVHRFRRGAERKAALSCGNVSSSRGEQGRRQTLRRRRKHCETAFGACLVCQAPSLARRTGDRRLPDSGCGGSSRGGAAGDGIRRRFCF